MWQEKGHVSKVKDDCIAARSGLGLVLCSIKPASMDSRVQDFLDDKLQAAADLESIDSLLHNVKAQQELLKEQVRIAL